VFEALTAAQLNIRVFWDAPQIWTDRCIFTQHPRNTWPLDGAGESYLNLSKFEEILAKWHGVSHRGTESFPDEFESEWRCLKLVASARPSVVSDGAAQLLLDGFS